MILSCCGRRAVSSEKELGRVDLSPWWGFQKVDAEVEKKAEGRARGFADAMPASAQRCSLQLTTVERWLSQQPF